MKLSTLFISFFILGVAHSQERVTKMCLSFITNEAYATECMLIANRYSQFSELEKITIIRSCKQFRQSEAQISCLEAAFNERAEKERHYRNLPFSKHNVAEVCNYVFNDLGAPENDHETPQHVKVCAMKGQHRGMTPWEIYACRKKFTIQTNPYGAVYAFNREVLSCIDQIGAEDFTEEEVERRRCPLSQRLARRCQ